MMAKPDKNSQHTVLSCRTVGKLLFKTCIHNILNSTLPEDR